MWEALDEAGLTIAQLGSHWLNARRETLDVPDSSLEDFQYLLQIFQRMEELGCPVSCVTWDTITTSFHLEADSDQEWIEKVQGKVLTHLVNITNDERQTNLPVTKKVRHLPGRPATPSNGEERDEFETGGERANAGRPGSFLPVIGGGQNDGDEDVVILEPWLGTQHIGALHERPSNTTHHAPLQSPEGRRMSVEDRFNLSEEAVNFEREACKAQLPTTISEPYYTACKARLQQMDVRVKPSTQDAFRDIARAAGMGRAAKFVNVMAALCFVHFCVQDSKNKFLRNHLEKLRLLDLTDPTFPCSTNLDVAAGTLRDRQGHLMTKISLESPGPKRQQNRPRRLEETKEGQRLKRRKIHYFSHVDEKGRPVYRTYYDTYIQAKEKIAELRQEDFGIYTGRDLHIERPCGRSTPSTS